MRGACAALVAAALLCAPAAARAAASDLPDLGPAVTLGHMPAGGTFVVHPLSGAPVVAVELWFRAPSTGFGAQPQPTLARLSAQAVAASKPIVGSALETLVEGVGGRLGITVYADSVQISALVPAASAQRVVRAMTTAYFAPVVTTDGVQSAVRDVEQEAALEQFNPETLLRDAVFGQLFATGPQHYPAIDEPGSVGDLGENDVRAFATRAFRSQNAVLVVCGDVKPDVADAAAAGRTESDANVIAPEEPAPHTLAAGPFDPVTRNFVLPSGAYGWAGPRIVDEREATALDFITDFLFRPETGVIAREVSAAQPDAFVVGQFITLRDPGVVFIAFAGKDGVALKAAVDRGLGRARTPLDAATFATALAAFEYHIFSDVQTPVQLADNYGWYGVEGNLAYAPGANGTSGEYYRAVQTLTPDFVAATSVKYLTASPVVVTMRPAPAATATPAPAATATPAPRASGAPK